MNRNNFDQSIQGLNIELSISLDNDQAQWEFEECFNIIQSQSYRKHTVASFTDHGNFTCSFSFTDFSEYSGITLKSLYYTLLSLFERGDLNDRSQYLYGKNLSKLNKQELIEFTENWFDSEDLKEFLQANFIPLYSVIPTRGYCQGDYAEVVFSNKFKQHWKKQTGNEFNPNSFIGTIDNLFWNSPIYACLTIDSTEYYLDQLLPDLYTYDKDDLITSFKKEYASKFCSDKMQIIVDFLSENLPEYPDYQ